MAADTTVSSDGAATEAAFGLDENLAGALAYVLGIITGIVFFVVEDDSQFVRFHAAQSIVVFGVIIVLQIGLSILSTIFAVVLGDASFITSIIGTLAGLGLSLVTFALWLFLMYKAYSGELFRVPVAAGIADSLV